LRGLPVNRRFRLTRSTDFKRVRSEGKSYAHPLVVLVAARSEADQARIGVSASRSMGKAVQRNRARRLLRESVRPLLPGLPPGWDLILIARAPLLQARFPEIQAAVQGLLRRAGLFKSETSDHVR
jgi:ribonuclease P protein component